MADVVLSISADNKELKKDLKDSGKILKGFAKKTEREKTAAKKKEIANEKAVTRANLREQNVRDRMASRLSRKRARNRLKQKNIRIRSEKAIEKSATRTTLSELRVRDRMANRLSRKRARNRLKQIKLRIRAEARADKEIEKNRVAVGRRRGRIARGIGRGVGRVAGGIGRAAAFNFDLVGIGLDIASFERNVIRLGENAKLSAEDQMKLADSINETAIATGIGRNKLLDFARATFDTGGGIDLVTDNLLEMGKSMQAFDSDAEATGKFLAALSNFGFKGKSASKAADIVAAQAVLGAISAVEFGRIGPELFGAGKAAGFKGEEGLAQIGALAQFAAKRAGSAAESKTAVVSLLKELFAKSKTIKSQFEVQTIQGGKLRDPVELIKAIIRNKGGNLGKVFGEEAIKAISPIALAFQETGGFQEFDRFVKTGLTARGNTQRIFDRVRGTSAFKIDQISALISVLTDKALLGGLDSIIGNLTDFAKDPKKIKALIDDFKSIGEAIVSLAGFVNAVMPNFKAIRNFFSNPFNIGINEGGREAADRRNKELGRFFDATRPGFKAPKQNLGFLGGAAEILIRQVFNIKGRKIATKTITEQNNPDTGAINRTTGRKIKRAAF